MRTTNQNAHIESRELDNSYVTRTTRRDEGELNVTVETDRRTGSSRLRFNQEGHTFELTGRQLRTLLRVINKHDDSFNM